MRAGYFLAIVMLAFVGGSAAAAQREFYSGYIGTVPPSPADQARTYFDRPETRRLLQQLETMQVSVAQAEMMLASTQTTLADLERMKLVRESNGYLHIAFPYFTASDMDMIHGVAEKYVPSLVAAFAARAPRIEPLLAAYPVQSVSRKRLAFVLIAGFGLNWDALDLLTQKNYRQPWLIDGAGWHYGFWAAEDLPGYSYRGYYWGSTSFPADALNLTPPLDLTFSSFGDPASDPRMNFPDLLAMPEDQMTPPVHQAAVALGLKDESELGFELKSVVGLSRGRAIGAILFAMRSGESSREKLCAALAADAASDCDGILGLLVASGYAKQAGEDHYALLVPVLDVGDAAMLEAVLAQCREIETGWLAQTYAPMRRELLRLTAVRQGIPYPALFSQIWHEMFGLATRELAASGTIEDPRAPDVVWQGSIPVVWRTAIYHHAWQ